MILFAAATGLRPAEWIALEKRDVDREEPVVYVRRSFTRSELKFPKTEASMRAVPLQARALDALDRINDGNGSPLLFRASGVLSTSTTSARSSGGPPRKTASSPTTKARNKQAKQRSPLTDSNRRPLSMKEGRASTGSGSGSASQGGRCGWAW